MDTAARPALVGAPPDPVSVRTALFPEGAVFPRQRAPWGKLLFAVHGVAEFWIDGELALSPPAYAIWIPPRHNVLGMSFQEWRQRCKLLSALIRLEAGQPVQTVAYDLGFRSPSAFIEMFRQRTGTTPGSVASRAHP